MTAVTSSMSDVARADDPLPSYLDGGDASVAFDDDALVGRLAPTAAGAVGDDKELAPGGWMRTPKPVSLSSQAIQGLSAGSRVLDGALGQRELDLRDALFGVFFHGHMIVACARESTR